MSVRQGFNIISGRDEQIPSLTGNEGKFLTNNGSTLEWTSIPKSTTVPWAINSGVRDAEGHNAIMGGVGTDTLTFDTTEPVLCTLADGTYIQVGSIASQPAPPSDSTFNVFFSPKYNDVRIFNNEISIQEAAPQAPSIIDTWLDTSVSPLDFKHWDGKGWIKTEYIWMGKITTVGGKITEIKNREFNVNGTEIKQITAVFDRNWDAGVIPSMVEGRIYTFPFDCILRVVGARNKNKVRLNNVTESGEDVQNVFAVYPSGELGGAYTGTDWDEKYFKKGQRVYVQVFADILNEKTGAYQMCKMFPAKKGV